MRALLSFVTGDNMDIAAIAVAVLKNLVSHPDNYNVLRLEEALLEGLKDLLVAQKAERDLRKDIFNILEELTDEKNDDEMDELDELEKSAGLKEEAPAATTDDPGLLKEPVMTRLRVPGISDELTCVRVEQLLIRKRGVISVGFETGAETAVLYTRIPADELASFVAMMTGSRVQVLPDVPSDEEEPEAKSEELDADVDKDKENGGGQPGYLDHTGQRFRDVAKRNAKKKNTISQGASSLTERLRAQREEENRKRARANRLMNVGRGMNSRWRLW